MKKLGIVGHSDRRFRVCRTFRPGKTLPMTARHSGRKMELYSAMVEHMDDHIGRLSTYLK